MEDSAVGKRQAMIEATGHGALTLVNLGGESGVALNGRWVEESPLEAGDRIQLGATEILLEEVVSSEAAQPLGVAQLPSAPFVQAHQPLPASVGEVRVSEAG